MLQALKLPVFASLLLAVALLLTACSTEQAPSNSAAAGARALPIDDPGDGILLVFENDGPLVEGYCKPVIKLAIGTDNPNQRLRYHVLLNGQPYLQMIVAKRLDTETFAYARQKMSPHQPIAQDCADLAIEFKELRCANPPDYYLEDCGRELRLQAEQFASVADIRA